MDIDWIILLVVGGAAILVTILSTIKSRKIASEIKENVRKKLKEETSPPSKTRVKGEKLRVLIVEDDGLQANRLKSILEEEKDKYMVVGIAKNVQEAEKLLEDTQPDFALLDIVLEEDANKGSGIDVAKIIEIKHHIPYAFISGNIEVYKENIFHKLHPISRLSKPYLGQDIRNLAYNVFNFQN